MEIISQKTRDGKNFIFSLLHHDVIILPSKIKSNAHDSKGKTPKISMKNYLEASSLRGLQFLPE